MGPVVPGGQLSQNHWSIYLILANGAGSVRFSMTADDRNPKNEQGIFNVTQHNYQVTNSCVQFWDFPTRANLTVGAFLRNIGEHGRQRYRMTSNGTGCRYWVSCLIHDFSQAAFLSPDAYEFLQSVIQYNYSRQQTPIYLPMQTDNFGARHNANSPHAAMEPDFTSKDSQSHIRELCHAARETRLNVISPPETTNLVVKLTANLAVKCGPGVTRAEAYALKFATEHLDSSIVRVPSFVQFFADDADIWPTGYLVMAFVDGNTLEGSTIDDVSIARKVLRAMQHIHSFTGTVPGPLDRTSARGLLWSDYGAGQPFESVRKLQEYLDTRLANFGPSIPRIDITESALCFCHMDISPRNMVLDDQGHLYLLDWGFAGFYPSIFELWSIAFEDHIRPHPLMLHLTSLLQDTATPRQLDEVQALNRVYAANQRYSFHNPDREAETRSILEAAGIQL
ncbi:uncharacterized protein RHO25_005959 [Cercospora beticola]|nr:hypothetical protein RHO25_005959 [Cercospora beticola]